MNLFFHRLISLILILQLMVACNSAPSGSVVKSGKAPDPIDPPNTEEVEINGSIAKVMDWIFPSAHAATGKLYLYDISAGPDSSEIIAQEELSGESSFSFKLKKELIQNKLLRLKFESVEGDEKGRTFLLGTDESAQHSVTLDEDSNLEHLYMEHLLRAELNRGFLAIDDLNSRFQDINSEDKQQIMSAMGDKSRLLEFWRQQQDISAVFELLTEIRLTTDEASLRDLQLKILDLSQVFSSDKPSLNCLGTQTSIWLKSSDKEYLLRFETDEPELHQIIGTEKPIEIGRFREAFDGNRQLLEIHSKFRQIATDNEKNYTGRVQLMDASGVITLSECRMYALKVEGETNIVSEDTAPFTINPADWADYAEAYDQMKQQYTLLLDLKGKDLELEGLTAGSEEFQKALSTYSAYLETEFHAKNKELILYFEQQKTVI